MSGIKRSRWRVVGLAALAVVLGGTTGATVASGSLAAWGRPVDRAGMTSGGARRGARVTDLVDL